MDWTVRKYKLVNEHFSNIWILFFSYSYIITQYQIKMTIKFILNKVFPRLPYFIHVHLCANKFLELAEISTLLFNQLFAWASLKYLF
jgi:hypothetical protein